MKYLAQCQAHHILNSIINMLTGGSLLLFSALSVKCLVLFFFFIHLCSFQLTWLTAWAVNFLNCFISQRQNTVAGNSFSFDSAISPTLAFSLHKI